MRDLSLPDRLRAKGVPVVLVAGWDTRGNADGFHPIGAVHHHTAGSSNGSTPSLAINIYGRSDVPGPLCQVLQSRETNPAADKAYVISSGKANHGGVGTWTGPAGTFNSNYECEGLEVEHTGYGPVPAARHEVSAKIIAAMLEAPGSSRDARMCCEHYEYARPLGRKVDFRDLNPPFANRADGFRARVAYWIGRRADQPEDWFDMATKADLDAVIKANLDDIANYVWKTYKIDLNPKNPDDTPNPAFVVLRDSRNLGSFNRDSIRALQADVDAIKAKLEIP